MKLITFLMAALVGSGADLVLRNGNIITLDPAKPQAEAIAITRGKIVAVGSNAQVAREIQASTKVVDLGGKVAIPGLIDGHAHFTGVGEMRMNLNLREAKSWDQIVAMVAAAAKEAKPGEWIVGRGWHQEKWDAKPVPNVKGFPVHDALSKAAPNNPVMLTHASGHGVFTNAAGMKSAGITKTTPSPAGGEIMKDAARNPTGMMNETAQGLVQEAMARDLAKRTPEQREATAQRVIDLAVQDAVSKGITSIQDAGSTPDVIERLKRRAAAGTLPIRLWVMLRESNELAVNDIAKVRITGFGDDHLTVRAMKHYIDGALGTRGAWMLAPYADLPSTSGANTEPLAEIEKAAAIAIENGFQLCVHAIGDRGNREVLNIFERTFKTHPEKKNLRWRIEHAQHIDPADIPRFASLGVIASMQPIHCTSDSPMVVPRLGEKRAAESAYVWQSLMKSGAHVSTGTDAPVEDLDPIANFYAAVTRRRPGGQAFHPEQKMSRMEALKSYTVENAYAAFEEDVKGRLKAGMLGDVTVLSQDILTVPEDDILKTRVEYTIVGGKIVYQRAQ
jgi:predicted amidohydrolase YtcJ